MHFLFYTFTLAKILHHVTIDTHGTE